MFNICIYVVQHEILLYIPLPSSDETVRWIEHLKT